MYFRVMISQKHLIAGTSQNAAIDFVLHLQMLASTHPQKVCWTGSVNNCIVTKQEDAGNREIAGM